LIFIERQKNKVVVEFVKYFRRRNGGKSSHGIRKTNVDLVDGADWAARRTALFAFRIRACKQRREKHIASNMNPTKIITDNE
jgi:hypothetical protein